MKKWIGLMALVTAANSVSATSLYEPFNYSVPAATPLKSLTNSSEVPSPTWTILPTAASVDPQIGSASTPIPAGSTALSYSGLAEEQGAFAYTIKSASGTADRIDLNASYAPGQTIYYSALVQVPIGSAAAATGSGSFFTGLQWVTTEVNSGNSSSQTSTSVAAPICIDYPGTNDSHGRPEFELGIAYRDSATRVFDTSPLLEGQTYLVVVKYVDGPNNNDDSASLYINPASSTFGGADPGLTPVATSTNTGSGLDYGSLASATVGAAYPAGYLGPDTSFILRNNSSETGNINVDDVRVDTSWAGVTAVEWTAAGSGGSDWGSGTNWTSGVAPSATGADVTFGTNSSIQNVTISSPQTVGTIRFNGTNSYTISGSSTLTLQENIGATTFAGGNSTGPASIQVTTGSHTISAPVMLASSTNLAVATGAALTLSGPVTAANGIALTVNGGGTASVKPASATALQGLSGLSVTGTSKLTLSAAHSAVTTTAFAIDATSTLDLTNNDLLVDYAPNAGNPTGTDTTTGPAVVAAVLAADDGGAWDKPGITTSLAPAGSGRTLAVVDNETLATPLTTVDSTALDASSVVVKYTWFGDLNLDGKVDSTDFGLMGVLNSTTSTPNWASGDLNYDGVINADDWALFQLGVAESNGASINSVPEPSAALALAAVGLIAARRRKVSCR